ncbi:MAG TPA: hypothetical protein VIX81_01540 [Gammaproteobacteria bacterium]
MAGDPMTYERRRWLRQLARRRGPAPAALLGALADGLAGWVLPSRRRLRLLLREALLRL